MLPISVVSGVDTEHDKDKRRNEGWFREQPLEIESKCMINEGVVSVVVAEDKVI